MKQLLLIIGIATIICACQPKQIELTPEQRQDIANVIKKDINDWIEDMGNPDITKDDSTSKWVESNDEVWMNNPALWLNGTTLYTTKEKIKELYGPVDELRSSTNFYIDEDYVAVISADCAVYVFKGSFTITNKEGITTDPVPLTGSYVYVLRNGEWKFLHIHQSWKTN